jgi:hypothetical protein
MKQEMFYPGTLSLGEILARLERYKPGLRRLSLAIPLQSNFRGLRLHSFLHMISLC